MAEKIADPLLRLPQYQRTWAPVKRLMKGVRGQFMAMMGFTPPAPPPPAPPPEKKEEKPKEEPKKDDKKDGKDKK